LIVTEKILTQLVLPCGLIWLGLIAASIVAWRRKQKTLLACLLVLLAMHTAAGNVPLGAAMLAWLERDYAHVRTLERGPYDAVVVLGGGTNTGSNGQAELDQAGDRVALAAQLYHAGRVRLLVVTGERIASLDPNDSDPGSEAVELLQRLAVPKDRILRLPGRNTSEEMAALAQRTAEHPEWKRLGLVTSAWHMPRALRLARNENVPLDPLPADFRGRRQRWTVLSIIPCAEGFGRTQIAVKEMLATVVGR
jgi:uncharacterized SAM-binding protein YcdF (DUF218 family)